VPPSDVTSPLHSAAFAESQQLWAELDPSMLASTSRLVDLAHYKSTSSSTVADANRRSNPPPARAARAPLRPRGKTESGSSTSREGSFLPREPTPPKASPRGGDGSDSPNTPMVIVRQASNSRLRVHTPPSAPPRIGLPPPPPPPPPPSHLDEADADSDHSSTRLSFASSISSHRDIIQALESAGAGFELARSPSLLPQDARQRVDSGPDLPPLSGPGSPPRTAVQAKPWATPALTLPLRIDPGRRTLKKAISQQSLGKPSQNGANRSASASTSSSSTPHSATVGDDGQVHPAAAGKAPRKQRSFHQTRLPLPSMMPLPPPLRHASSFTPKDKDEGSPRKGAESDPRRASTSSSNTPRKRLFSGPTLRRTSTQHAAAAAQDDARSVFSLPADEPRGTHAHALASPGGASWWDETAAPRAAEKTSTDSADYQPQQILSPAEMLELEAAFEEEHDVYVRSRGTSFTSVSTADMSLSSHGHGHVQAVDRPTSSSSTAAAAHLAGIRMRDRSFSNRIGADAYQPLAAAAAAAAATTTATTPAAPTSMPPARSLSLMHRPARGPALAMRPATAQAPPSPVHTAFPPRPSTGLSPPPPRRRRTQTAADEPPASSLSSPLSRRLRLPGEPEGAAAAGAAAHKRVSVVPISPLSPPPSRRGAPPPGAMRKQTIEQALFARAPPAPAPAPPMAKKPSFLDIGAERVQAKTASVHRDSRPVLDSFLDLERSSFDTVRSDPDFD
jgi:hypothetical protein